MTHENDSPKINVSIGNFDFHFEGTGEQLRRQIAEGARKIADILEGKPDSKSDLGGAGIDPLKGRT